MTDPRLHQSYAKDLLSCPALVKRRLDGGGRKPTACMELGTLVDRLVFGGDDWQVVEHETMADGTVRVPIGWATKSAKAQAKAIRDDGKVPVLPHELERERVLAEAALSCLSANGIDLRHCHVQETMRWVGPQGVACEGTPDAVWVQGGAARKVIDLKVTNSADPDWVESQAARMGWHIQGAAYLEATGASEHVILAVGTGDGMAQATWNPLSDDYVACGGWDWSKAAAVWKRCLETGVWPGYTGRTLNPPRWLVMRHFGGDGDLSGLGLEG